MTKKEESLEINPETAKELAAAIRRIDKAVSDLQSSGLNRKALVVLLNESTGVSRRDINAVLNGLESLEKEFLEPEKK